MDAEHCLILHYQVTQEGDDRKQLESIAKAAKAELGQDTLTVTADMGYSNGPQLQASEEASISVYVLPNRTPNLGGETLSQPLSIGSIAVGLTQRLNPHVFCKRRASSRTVSK